MTSGSRVRLTVDVHRGPQRVQRLSRGRQRRRRGRWCGRRTPDRLPERCRGPVRGAARAVCTLRARASRRPSSKRPIASRVATTTSSRCRPMTPATAGSMEVAGDMFGLLSDRPEAAQLMAWLVGTEAQRIWVEEGTALSGNLGVSAYPDVVTRREAQLLASATDVRFDASDQMDTRVCRGVPRGSPPGHGRSVTARLRPQPSGPDPDRLRKDVRHELLRDGTRVGLGAPASTHAPVARPGAGPLAGRFLVQASHSRCGSDGARRSCPRRSCAGRPAPLAIVVCSFLATTLGAFLASRIPDNPVAWLLLLQGLVMAPVLVVTVGVWDSLGVLRPTPVSRSWPHGSRPRWSPRSGSVPWLPCCSCSRTATPCPIGGGGPCWCPSSGTLLLSVGSALDRTMIWYPVLPMPAGHARLGGVDRDARAPRGCGGAGRGDHPGRGLRDLALPRRGCRRSGASSAGSCSTVPSWPRRCRPFLSVATCSTWAMRPGEMLLVMAVLGRRDLPGRGRHRHHPGRPVRYRPHHRPDPGVPAADGHPGRPLRGERRAPAAPVRAAHGRHVRRGDARSARCCWRPPSRPSRAPWTGSWNGISGHLFALAPRSRRGVSAIASGGVIHHRRTTPRPSPGTPTS